MTNPIFEPLFGKNSSLEETVSSVSKFLRKAPDSDYQKDLAPVAVQDKTPKKGKGLGALDLGNINTILFIVVSLLVVVLVGYLIYKNKAKKDQVKQLTSQLKRLKRR